LRFHAKPVSLELAAITCSAVAGQAPGAHVDSSRGHVDFGVLHETMPQRIPRREFLKSAPAAAFALTQAAHRASLQMSSGKCPPITMNLKNLFVRSVTR
jgi:hypothetical protein